MAWVALTSEIVFVLVGVLLRVWLQRRWTGASGVALDRSGASAAEQLAGAGYAAAVALLALAPLLAIWDSRVVLEAEPGPFVAGLGVVFAAAGLAVTFWAQLVMRDSWRIGVDRETETELVTTGPFRLVRNPIYTAMVVFAVGVMLMLPSAITAAAVAALVIGTEIQVRLVEEPFLLAGHAERYREWARETGRFVPVFGRLP